MRSTLLCLAGWFCLGVGAVGVLVPVLPTTPFVLLAAGCFGGSSPRLYGWLARTRYFGAFLENYRAGGGVPKAVKVRSLVFLWGMLTLSMALTRSPHLTLFLSVVGIGVSAHILKMKTKQ